MATRTIFDHVPKTGGTSIRAAICNAHGRDFAMPAVGISHHQTMARPHEQDFLSWHLWYLPGESLVPGWFYATMLREPVDRFLSQYYFHRGHFKDVEEGRLTSPEVVQATRLSLEEYVRSESKDLRRSYSNLQAMHFAWRMCAEPEQLNERDLLDAAIAGLDGYDLVGVFDDMQGFLDRYCDALSLPRQDIPCLNVTPSRKKTRELPSAVMQTLRDANGVDTALYAWAEQRFAQRAAKPVVVAAGLPEATAACAGFGSRKIRIHAAHCQGAGGVSPSIAGGTRMTIVMQCLADVTEADLTAGIAIHDADGAFVCGFNSRQLDVALAMEEGRCYDMTLEFSAPAAPGRYQVTLALHRGDSHLDGCHHWLPDALDFVVQDAAAASERVTPSIGLRCTDTEGREAELPALNGMHVFVKQRPVRTAMRKVVQQMKSLMALQG